jgi:hypothetical protein
MRRSPCACALVVSLAAAAGFAGGVLPAGGAPYQPEKDRRTPALQKIDSQLLQEIGRKRGQAAAKDVPSGKTDVRIDAQGRALVDIRATVSPALTAYIKKIGGTVMSSAPQYRSTIARVPLLKLEQLAGRTDVRAISPAPEAEIRPPSTLRKEPR